MLSANVQSFIKFGRDLLWFSVQILSVHQVRPDALYDFEDFIANVEFVEKLCMRACTFSLNVKLHQGMQKMLHGKFGRVEDITQDTLGTASERQDAMEKDCHQAGFEVRTFDVFGTP